MTETMIDWAALEARFPNKPAFVGRLLRSTLDYYENSVAEVTCSLVQQDSEKVFEFAHALKSTAGNLCAPELLKTAERVLGEGRDFVIQNESLVRTLLAQLEQTLLEAKHWLDHVEVKG